MNGYQFAWRVILAVVILSTVVVFGFNKSDIMILGHDAIKACLK